VSFYKKTFYIFFLFILLIAFYSIFPALQIYIASKPKAVTPRGKLSELEKNNIKIFEETKDCVVYISTLQKVLDFWSLSVFDVPKGTGSGFVWDEFGHIVTNFHVIEGASKAIVRLSNGRDYKAVIVGSDPTADLAVLKIKPVLGVMKPVKIGSVKDLRVGEIVYAIGNPFGLDWTMTMGIISALDRVIDEGNGIKIKHAIQTDAAINPGNSGGPLINIKGEVVGVNTAIFSKSGGYMGIGFAIPINMVKAIEKQLIEKGEVTRGYLGVMIQEMTPDLRKSFGLKENQGGVLISDVIEGSPAQKAGLKRGDVVIEFNGKKVTDVSEFRNMVALTPPGTKVKVVVIRKGKRKEFEVVLGNLRKATIALSSKTEILKKLGFSVQNLTKDLAEQFGYTNEKGVLISQVAPGSPAEQAGLEPGMLIMEVNRIPVKNTKQFFKALAKSKKTGKVLLLVYDGEYTRYVLLSLR